MSIETLLTQTRNNQAMKLSENIAAIKAQGGRPYLNRIHPDAYGSRNSLPAEGSLVEHDTYGIGTVAGLPSVAYNVGYYLPVQFEECDRVRHMLAVDLDYIDAKPLTPREIVKGQFVAAVLQIEEDDTTPTSDDETQEDSEEFVKFMDREFNGYRF
jgi:hypothetical protein